MGFLLNIIFFLLPMMVILAIYGVVVKQERGKNQQRRPQTQRAKPQAKKEKKSSPSPIPKARTAKTEQGSWVSASRDLAESFEEWAGLWTKEGQKIGHRQKPSPADQAAKQDASRGRDAMQPRRLEARVLQPQVLEAEESLAGEQPPLAPKAPAMVPGAETKSEEHPQRPDIFGAGDRASLQRAFILKEVLDKPVSMRKI